LMKDAELLQSTLEAWDEIFQQIEDGGDLTYGFLRLARNDLRSVTQAIECSHCRRQIVAEVQLIEIVLQLSRLANQWTLARGVHDRLRLAGLALPLIGRITYLQIKKLF
jgi:hypothetical protein